MTVKSHFEIKVKSVDTGLGKRDKHLRSADFFDASKYPLMTFTSNSITRAEGNTYNVNGTLTIKDVSAELVLPLAFAGIRENPLAPDLEVAGFNGRLTLDRLAYNVGGGKYYQMGAVGKDVDILVTIEGLAEKIAPRIVKSGATAETLSRHPPCPSGTPGIARCLNLLTGRHVALLVPGNERVPCSASPYTPANPKLIVELSKLG